jgi:hypothetical protein
MAQNEEKSVTLEGKLCIKCLEMYGNPTFEHMCSICYKYLFA